MKEKKSFELLCCDFHSTVFRCELGIEGFQKFAKSAAAVEKESEKSKTGSGVDPMNTLQTCKYTYFLNILVVTSVVGFLNN